MTTRAQWAAAALYSDGFQVNADTIEALVTVASLEDSTAWWNPADTTQPMPGATPYNDIPLPGGGVIHVWNYPDAVIGIEAFRITIRDGAYAALRTTLGEVGTNTPSESTEAILAAWTASPWGGGADYSAMLATVRANPAAYHDAPVEGPGPWPYTDAGAPVGIHGPQEVTVQLEQLARGDSGPNVGTVQTLLNYKMARTVVPVNERFGENTHLAVQEFQRKAGIADDGVVGPVTWQHLIEDSAAVPPARGPEAVSNGATEPTPNLGGAEEPQNDGTTIIHRPRS